MNLMTPLNGQIKQFKIKRNMNIYKRQLSIYSKLMKTLNYYSSTNNPIYHI
jgi:hypothetical protein